MGEDPGRAESGRYMRRGRQFQRRCGLRLRGHARRRSRGRIRQSRRCHYHHEEGNRNGHRGRAAGPKVNTLAIDIGGTKFTIAVFDDNGAMIRRESRATDREGGKDWMLAQIALIARGWAQSTPLNRCAIGFGGPVDFERQMVALSTHVGGWADFDLCGWVRTELGMESVVMDND